MVLLAFPASRVDKATVARKALLAPPESVVLKEFQAQRVEQAKLVRLAHAALPANLERRDLLVQGVTKAMLVYLDETVPLAQMDDLATRANPDSVVRRVFQALVVFLEPLDRMVAMVPLVCLDDREELAQRVCLV